MKKIFLLFVICFIANNIIYAQDSTLLKIAENGDVDVQLYLAEAYFYGKDGIKKNTQESRKWYEKAAEQGNAYAEYALYNFNRLLKGRWVANDLREALPHLERAANMGYIPAVFEINLMGIVQGKYEKAIPGIIEAAQNDYPPAYMVLADCYRDGLGVTENIDAAINYYQKAIDRGVNMAFLGMGDCYYKKKKDYQKAIEYYKKAIEADIPQAYNNLAYMYAKGGGVEKNVHEAHRLVDIAISKNPSEPEYYDSKGEFYLMEGNNDKAKEMWEKVVALDPNVSMRTSPLALAMNNNVDNNIPIMDSKAEKTFAIIIANQEYKRVSTVPFAKNDGKVFSDYCIKTLGIPEKNVYLVDDATLGDIKYHINLAKKMADAFNGEARIIIYYAGHGIPDEKDKTAYLLPVDGYANDATCGLSLRDFYSELESIPAKSVVVFLDACFSGANREGEMLVSARGVAIKPKQDAPNGNMVVLSAAQGDETAYPYNEKGHGMFTYYLLKKIQETKGDVTLGELADYVTSEVKKQSVITNGKIQTPLASPSVSAINWRSWKLR